ncbi:MAG TPA: ABC transporter substrate-binding protein [Epulopiscium sp.]|nr:ABC transporter substrate-binding protein [Candidatus Epulonipiscium sp.]
MNKFKKMIALILTIGTLTALTGCAGAQKANKDADAPVTTAPAAPEAKAEESKPSADKELIYVGFVQVGAESDWRMANTMSMQQTFVEANGFKFEMVDAQQKTDKQITAIRDFIQKDVDYIVLAPNTEAGWDTVLGEAKDAGIPVIIVDRMIQTSDDSNFTAWVGSNFKQEGYDAVKALEKALELKGVPADQKINIVTLQGTMGSSAQIGRTDGFAEKMSANANWNMLDRQSGDFTQEKGQEVMESFLKSHSDINVVIAENDNMAFGAINAIKAAGKTCGPNGDITIVSFDAVKAAFESMIAGDIDVDVECNPLHGPRVQGIIETLESGGTVDKIAYVEEGTFFAKDAAALIGDRAY